MKDYQRAKHYCVKNEHLFHKGEKFTLVYGVIGPIPITWSNSCLQACLFFLMSLGDYHLLLPAWWGCVMCWRWRAASGAERLTASLGEAEVKEGRGGERASEPFHHPEVWTLWIYVTATCWTKKKNKRGINAIYRYEYILYLTGGTDRWCSCDFCLPAASSSCFGTWLVTMTDRTQVHFLLTTLQWERKREREGASKGSVISITELFCGQVMQISALFTQSKKNK